MLTPSLPCSRAVNALGFVTPEPTAAAPQCSEHPACGSAGVGPPGTCTAGPSSSQSLQGPAASAPGSHFSLDPYFLHCSPHLGLFVAYTQLCCDTHNKKSRGAHPMGALWS